MFKQLIKFHKYLFPYKFNFPFSSQPPAESKLPDTLTENELPNIPIIPAKNQLQIKTLEELDIPFNIYGNTIDIEPKSKFIASQVLSRSKISEPALGNHLTKIFMGTVYSMANQDKEFLSEYAEENFASTILEKFGNLLKNGYHIQAYEDLNGNFGEPIPKSCAIKDMVMVRGVSINRKENAAENQYHKYIDNEDMGLVIYTPLEITEPKNFINPEKNKTIYDSYKKAVMRVLAEIKCEIRLKIFRPNGEEIPVKLQDYSWRHLAVFETQMKPAAPLKSSYKLENYMEWITKFTLGVWKISDIDNFMMGNPLILTGKKQEKFTDEIFKGTKYDPKARIDLRNI